MKYFKSILFIFFLCVACIFLWFKMESIESSKPEMIINETLNITPKKFERNWKNARLKEITLHQDIRDSIYRPVDFIKDEDNNLYVIDFGDMRIKKFNKEGRFITTIGKGKGKGPEENLMIVDLTVDRDTVFIVDSRALTLSKYTTSGDYIESFTLELRPLGVTTTNSGPVVMAFPSDSMFWQYNQKGKVMNRFGKLIENQVQNALSMSGDLIKNKKGGFLYLNTYASLIYYYGDNGALQKVTRRPDGFDYPGVIDKSTEDRKMMMAPSSKIEQRGVSIEDGLLYVIMIVDDKESGNGSNYSGRPEYDYSIVDMYELKSGKYLESIRLPFLVREAHVISDRLYVNYENSSIKAYTF